MLGTSDRVSQHKDKQQNGDGGKDDQRSILPVLAG